MEEENTPFTLTVTAADNIDRFDAFRIYEELHYINFREKSLDEKKEFCKNKLQYLAELMNDDLGTDTANILWQERLNFQKNFYKRMARQFETSECFR